MWPKSLAKMNLSCSKKNKEKKVDSPKSSNGFFGRKLHFPAGFSRRVGDGKVSSGSEGERTRPPLVEGRAHPDNDILEFVSYKQKNLMVEVPDHCEGQKTTDPASDRSPEHQEDQRVTDECYYSLASEPLPVNLDKSDTESAKQESLSDKENQGSVNLGSSSNQGKEECDKPLQVNRMGSPVVGSATQQLQQQQQQGDQTSPTTTHTGSEHSRDVEPEGSIDLTNPSESQTPPYLRWTNGIQYLLEHYDGCELFEQYLKDQNLEHYMNFWYFCNGIKDLEPSKVPMAGRQAYERCLTSDKTHNRPPLIDCVSDSVLRTIRYKLTEAKSVDVNMFDDAQQEVVDYMSRTFFLKFFESDIYIEYVREAQRQHQQHQKEELSGTNSPCRSSSSSVSGKQQQQGTEQQQQQLGARPKIFQKEGSSAAAASSSDNQQSLNLDPVDENAEMSFEKKKTAKASAAATAALSSNALRQTQSQRLRAHYQRPSAGPLETYPSGGTPSVRDRSYPFHARSSTFNPVSRNDSEIQSQSSGALGDDSSSFFGAQQQEQQQQKQQQAYERRRQEQLKRFMSRQNVAPGLMGPRPVREGQEAPRPIKPKEFAAELIKKLNNVKKEREIEDEMKKKLEAMDQSSSVVSGGCPMDLFGNPVPESDESILDEHCQRVFKNEATPSRSPPGASSSSRRHPSARHGRNRSNRKINNTANSTTSLDVTGTMQPHQRLMSQSFDSGGRWIGGFGHHTWGNGRRQKELCVFGPQPQQQGYHPASSGMAAPQGTIQGSFASNSAFSYAPTQTSTRQQQLQQRSFSDYADFGASSHNQSANFPHHHSNRQMMRHNFPQQSYDDKVSNWVKNVQQHQVAADGLPGNGTRSSSVSRGGLTRSSPRSSGRRSRSQDRAFMEREQFGTTARPPQQLPPQQPQPQPQPQQQPQQSPPSSLVNNVQVIFKYRNDNPNEKLPYVTRYHGPPESLTLLEVKKLSPRPGHFRFYFFTKLDGQEVREEVSNNSTIVPTFGPGKVIVECLEDKL